MKKHKFYKECSYHDSSDLKYDYLMMLEDFGPGDDLVKLYKFILEERGDL